MTINNDNIIDKSSFPQQELLKPGDLFYFSYVHQEKPLSLCKMYYKDKNGILFAGWILNLPDEPVMFLQKIVAKYGLPQYGKYTKETSYKILYKNQIKYLRLYTHVYANASLKSTKFKIKTYKLYKKEKLFDNIQQTC